MDHLLYQSHFGLCQAPFNITPDPAFLYPSPSHQEGLAQLSYGVRARKGFVVLTGEVGTGKTTLIHALLKELKGSCQTALIFNSIVSPADLLRSVCEEFGLIDPKRSLGELHDYLVSLNEFLLESYRKDENCVLIIDEAQNLSPPVLESIRLLSNFETSKDKLLQIVLAGQPELAVRLNSPELRQLKQRVLLRHHLRALSLEECREYVSNRLKIAGANRPVFASDALGSIYSYSGGIPRLVNVLCDNALLTAYALRKSEVDPRIIEEVAQDLSITNSAEARFKPVRHVINSANGNRSSLPSAMASIEIAPRVAPIGPRPAGVKQIPKNLPSTPFVPKSFFDVLVSGLTEAMGPMAKIVLRDQINALGESSEAFPQEKLGALLESVSAEVLDERMRLQFQQQMLRRIRRLTVT